MRALLRRLRLELAMALLPPAAGAAKGSAPNPAVGQGGGTKITGTKQADVMLAGQYDFATASGCSLFSGTGAPGANVGLPSSNPVAGDFYLRTDTPSTASQRLYVCTVGGGAPTWVGIV